LGVASQPPTVFHVDGPMKDPDAVPRLMMIGTSYKSADISFRENLVKAVGADHMVGALDSAKEVALLSTCNRFELYVASESPEDTCSSFLKSVAEATGQRAPREAFYQAMGPGAVKHLFRVATGLDSAVVGEPQILAQVRAAGISSRKDGSAGAILAPLFDRAYRVGLRVRNEYDLGSEEASLSDLAVEAVRRMAPGMHDVMLIGTGKMVRLAARKLREGAAKVFVVTKRREPPRGLEDAVLVPYSGIRKTAAKCDVIISATSTDRPILKGEDLKGRRKRMVVDLGMPRNVSPDVRKLPGVRLVDLDDLAKIASARKTPAGLRLAEAATEREADQFYDWLVQTRLSSALAELYSWADAVRAEELERALGKLNLDSGRDRRVLDAMSRRIVSKLLARPTRFARKKQGALSEEEKLELLRSVFGADSPDGR
jgi:glutamyl-tRNA reductase